MCMCTHLWHAVYMKVYFRLSKVSEFILGMDVVFNFTEIASYMFGLKKPSHIFNNGSQSLVYIPVLVLHASMSDTVSTFLFHNYNQLN